MCGSLFNLQWISIMRGQIRLSAYIFLYLGVLDKIFHQSGPYFPHQKGWWSAVQKDFVPSQACHFQVSIIIVEYILFLMIYMYIYILHTDLYMGQFLQDGKNVRFMSFFLKWKAGVAKRYWWLLSICGDLSWMPLK